MSGVFDSELGKETHTIQSTQDPSIFSVTWFRNNKVVGKNELIMKPTTRCEDILSDVSYVKSEMPGYKTPDEYAKAVFKVLGPNFQICSSDTNYMDDNIIGTYRCYYLKNFDYSNFWGKDGISLNFETIYHDQNNKRQIANISIKVIFSNGYPTSIETCSVHRGDKAFSLNNKDVSDKILPKIKDLKYSGKLG